MAELFIFSVAKAVLGKIASPAFQEAVAIYSIEDQIHELKNTVAAITAVLLDAEEQRAENRSLQLWLGRLRDVLYDAEDLLDELECEALRKRVISRYGGVKEKVHHFFSLSNPVILRAKISHKINEIRETLSKIFIDKNQFGLNVRRVDNGMGHLRSREMTHSFINKLDVVGRDVDKQKIIEILMWPDHENLSVVPIVGIGGMGKTALAKSVCNDDSVKAQFELLLWVCVPEDFDLKKTIDGIIKDANSQSLSNLDIQPLQTILRNTIKDKKFLLVLDDVWSNDRSRWEELKALLTEGAHGSKIIVTTRSSEVASMMGTHPTHNLKGLSHEDSMALFKKWAFDEKEKQPYPDLLDIGNDIVKKCQGVPLLVKTMGSLLYTENEERYWVQIRDSEIWKLVEQKKDVLPVLKLSYDHLPSHLKRCFATLSLFPREYRIRSTELVMLWMSLGLISSSTKKLALEDGVEYIKVLWKRSLIQEVEEYRSILCFKMHDLLHSLAMIVAQDDCSVIGLDTVEISERVRYISFSTYSLEGISNFDGVPPFLRKPTSKRLHAIKFQFKLDDGVITREFIGTCISKCNHLRYLDLQNGSFEELPSSICNLKQLRLLFLGYNKRLKKLPDSICELQSLLYLDLAYCSELGDLPKKMKRLISLRQLSVITKQMSMQESGIQYLENLELLVFRSCQNLRVLFEGACRLTCLRKLGIIDCVGPISLSFVELIALEYLVISNCKLKLTQDNKSNFPSNLRTLSIAKSEQVMELLQCFDESAYALEFFGVYDCPSFTTIPVWLPNHIRLRVIRLIRCPNLSSIPQEIQSLIALKELCIEYCGELSERCRPTIGKDWPNIAHIPRIELDLEWVQWMED